MPTDSRDKAKAMILTDHYLAVPDLEGLGERIRDGLPVTYPQEAIAGYIVAFEEEAARLSVRKRRMKLVAFLLALLAVFLLLAGCDRPGVRGTGVASATVGAGAELTGSCEYSVETRWSSQLRHILRLKANEGSASIVLQSRRAWSQGRRDFSAEVNRTLLGLVLDGATVEGGILGSLRIEKTSDSLIVDVNGQVAGRDTVPLVARCRIGLE